MVKILHAADFHLDSPFLSLTPEQARQRRGEARRSVLRLARFANAEHADLTLLAGDLFDGLNVYRETAETLAEALSEIKGRVFIAPGNHDPYDPQGPYGAVVWPDNVHIFKSRALEAVELPELQCVVYGAAFTEPEESESPLRGFRAPQDGRSHILVLHGDVDGGRRYRPIPRGEIAESGLTYAALGHVHQFSGIQKLWRTTWAYAGCPEGRGFDECGPHGVILGTVDPEGCDLRFVSFAKRKYEILRLDVTGRAPADALLQAVEGAGAAADVYRVIFTGEQPAGGVDLDAVRRAAEGQFYQLELRDETRMAEDLWQHAGEDSLRGLFLKELLRRRAQASGPEEEARVERAARFGLAALEGRDF